ncbi:MAG: DNA methyltransferase, partial [Victivallaceae bacterium]|nr:DNA methyltransferase [Victivallaceae bacterium]
MAGELFKSKFVPGKPGSGNLFDEELMPNDRPVVCLGIEFPNDEARREYFTEKLREFLSDPEFRKIEGFPIGEDEDILALSDPPYYCACPNPWIGDFIRQWESEKPQKNDLFHYVREPFAADVSEGKNDPIYNAHSYHTKVPHKAIMRYILHYTSPGDIVFDGFCGTGMTGVAAQMCGDINAVRELGYRVDERTGNIFDPNAEDPNKPFSKIGTRKAILNDLSPAATFIAYNYNTPVDIAEFKQEAKRILAEVEKECGWMYETQHVDANGKPVLDSDGKPIIGKINCVIWGDVFVCPNCMNEVVFWEAAIDSEAGKVKDEFSCSHCKTMLTKRNMERAWITKFDTVIGQNIKQAKQVPALISYGVNNHKFEKKPDINDLQLINKIESLSIPYDVPCMRMLDGQETRRNDPYGITHVHHFYTKRNLYTLSKFKNAINGSRYFRPLQYQFDSLVIRQSKLTRFLISYYFHGGGGWIGTPLSGTLYIPSFSIEVQPFETWKNRIAKTLIRMKSSNDGITISTEDAGQVNKLHSCSVDYIFIDPPFGSNLNYSELSFLCESWLKNRTNNITEAIESKTQGKNSETYRKLMTVCFSKTYTILKPGRWITVEFSNTSAGIWNGIQTALADAGFIVANVSALDKKQMSFKAVNTPTAVKQDLVISAYKPNGGFEERFITEAGTEEGVWDFIRTHLKYLPVAKIKDGKLVTISERDPRILFDQLVAYYVRKGYNVPISSSAFQEGLAQRFDPRDGMYFLHDQALEYERKKSQAGTLEQGSLFVSDEASAIAWLRQLLKNKPQTFQDINPLFMRELSGWNKYEQTLELAMLLDQNFLCYDGKGALPSQIHAY